MHIIPLFQFRWGVFISIGQMGKYTGLKTQKEPKFCSICYIYIYTGGESRMYTPIKSGPPRSSGFCKLNVNLSMFFERRKNSDRHCGNGTT